MIVWCIDWLFDCLFDWLIDWLIDRLIDWLIDWLSDCDKSCWIDVMWLYACWFDFIGWSIDWYMDRLIDRSIDWLSCRSLAWSIFALMDLCIDWLMYWHIYHWYQGWNKIKPLHIIRLAIGCSMQGHLASGCWRAPWNFHCCLHWTADAQPYDSEWKAAVSIGIEHQTTNATICKGLSLTLQAVSVGSAEPWLNKYML